MELRRCMKPSLTLNILSRSMGRTSSLLLSSWPACWLCLYFFSLVSSSVAVRMRLQTVCILLRMRWQSSLSFWLMYILRAFSRLRMALLKSQMSMYSSPSFSNTSPTSLEFDPNSSSFSFTAVSIMSMAAGKRPCLRQSRLMLTQQSPPPFFPRIDAALTQQAMALLASLSSWQQPPTQKQALLSSGELPPKTSSMWLAQIWQSRMQFCLSSWQMLAMADISASFFSKNCLARQEQSSISGRLGMLRRSSRKWIFSRRYMSASCLASTGRLIMRQVRHSRHTAMPYSNSLNISLVVSMCRRSSSNSSLAITMHWSYILWLKCSKQRFLISRRCR